MPRYELIEKCLFVDAYYLDNLDINKPLRNPPAISPMPGDPAGAATAQVTPASSSPKAHVMDKRSSPAKYLALNDVAGFIARFIVQGVDTDLYLPQIIVSEYGISPDQAKNDIKNVLDWLLPYLKSRTKQQNPRTSPKFRARTTLRRL